MPCGLREPCAKLPQNQNKLYQLSNKSLTESENQDKPIFRRRAEKLVEHAVRLGEHRMTCGKRGCIKFREITVIVDVKVKEG